MVTILQKTFSDAFGNVLYFYHIPLKFGSDNGIIWSNDGLVTETYMRHSTSMS